VKARLGALHLSLWRRSQLWLPHKLVRNAVAVVRATSTQLTWLVAVDDMYVSASRYAAVAMVHHHVPRDVITATIGVRSAQLVRWLNYWRRSGSVWHVPERQNRHEDSFWEDDTLLRAIIALARDHPLALLREHTIILSAMRALRSWEFAALRASRSTVNRKLRRLGLTRKVIIRLYRAANQKRRREHAVLRQMAGNDCIVSVDETHTDCQDVLRRYGRSLRHERVYLLDINPRHVQRVSTTMAVSSDGRIIGLHSVTCERCLTSNDWRLFLGRVMQKIGRYTPGVPWDMQAPACVLLRWRAKNGPPGALLPSRHRRQTIASREVALGALRARLRPIAS